MTIQTPRRTGTARKVLTALAASSFVTSGGLLLATPLVAATPPATPSADETEVQVSYAPGTLVLATTTQAASPGASPSARVSAVTATPVRLPLAARDVPSGLLAEDQIEFTILNIDGPGHVVVEPAAEAGSDWGPGDPVVTTAFAGASADTVWTFAEPGDYSAVLLAEGALLDGTELVSDPHRVEFLVSDPVEDPADSLGSAPADSAGGVEESSEVLGDPIPAEDSTEFDHAEEADGLESAAHVAEPFAAAPFAAPRAAPLSAEPLAAAPQAAEPLAAEPLAAEPLAAELPMADPLAAAPLAAEPLAAEPLAAAPHAAAPRAVAPTDTESPGGADKTQAQPEESEPVCLPTEITEESGAGAADVVTSGHFDFGPVVEGGGMIARVKDDRSVPAQWIDPGSLIFHLTDTAAVEAPGGQFDFLGSGTVWQIPLTQSSGVPSLGWNTQHPTIAGHVDGGITLTLDNVEGPGQLGVYTLNSFGQLGEKYFGTMAGFDRSTVIEVGGSGVHVHAIWAFSQPGAYYTTLTFSGNVDGRQQSATATLTFFVGPGDASSAARSQTVTRTVGRTADGEPCELPSGAGGGGGSSQLAVTGPEEIADTLSLAVTFMVVGLAFTGARALAPRETRTRPSLA